jgi:hypothetical protein
MKLAFGIVAILVGLWWLYGIFRGLRPHYSIPIKQQLRTHHLGDLVNVTLLVIMFCGTGVLLLMDFRFWWVLLPSCAVIIALWTMFYGRKMKREQRVTHSKE